MVIFWLKFHNCSFQHVQNSIDITKRIISAHKKGFSLIEIYIFDFCGCHYGDVMAQISQFLLLRCKDLNRHIEKIISANKKGVFLIEIYIFDFCGFHNGGFTAQISQLLVPRCKDFNRHNEKNHFNP